MVNPESVSRALPSQHQAQPAEFPLHDDISDGEPPSAPDRHLSAKAVAGKMVRAPWRAFILCWAARQALCSVNEWVSVGPAGKAVKISEGQHVGGGHVCKLAMPLLVCKSCMHRVCCSAAGASPKVFQC